MSSILFLLLFPGEDYFNCLNFDEAERYYRLFAKINPSYEIYYNAGICCLIQNEPNSAIELLARQPNKKSGIYYYLGVAHYRLGIYDKAFRYFDLSRSSEENGTSPEKTSKKIGQSDYYLGLICLTEKRFAEAKEYLKTTPDSVNTSKPLNYLLNYEQLVAAQKNFIEGQYDRAVKLYEKVEDFFGFKEIGLAMTYAKIGDYEKALNFLETVIAGTNDQKLVAQALIEAGKISFRLKNYSMAKIYLKNYLEILSDNDAQYLLALSFNNENMYDSAAIYFRELPDSVDEYLFHKGRTDYFRGQWGSAEEKLLRHREFFPNSSYADRAIYILGSINFKRKEYYPAIDFWNDLINLYPNSSYAASAAKGIADAYFNLKEYKNALSVYKKVKEYRPSTKIESETKLKIYETLYYLKRYFSLVEALRRFIEENPNLSASGELVANTRLRIAKILFDEKEYYQSLNELDKLIVSYPDAPIIQEALVERARVCQNIGDEQEVKKSFQQLLTKTDGQEYYSYAVSELGRLYLKESKYDSALHYYNLLLDFDKYREMAIFEIAKIYDILGQNNEAETVVDKLIVDFPNSVFLFDAYILKSKSYRRRGNYAEAIKILEKLMAAVGIKPEIYLEIGDIYFEMNDYLKARDNYLFACDQFKQQRDNAARALLLAGDASIAMGDKKSAKEYYLRANLIAQSLTVKNQSSAKLMTISEE